jgi:AraC-like DNA-binding protein
MTAPTESVEPFPHAAKVFATPRRGALLLLDRDAAASSVGSEVGGRPAGRGQAGGFGLDRQTSLQHVRDVRPAEDLVPVLDPCREMTKTPAPCRLSLRFADRLRLRPADRRDRPRAAGRHDRRVHPRRAATSSSAPSSRSVHTDWTVAFIATRLGFAEPTNFSRFFTRNTARCNSAKTAPVSAFPDLGQALSRASLPRGCSG